MKKIERIQFLIQDSVAKSYEVTFVRTGKELTAFCTCQAAQNGLSCKHRLNILDGGQNNIVSDNPHEVAIVQTWLPNTSIQRELRNVKISQARVKAANWELSEAKRRLAQVMHTPTEYEHDTDITIIK